MLYIHMHSNEDIFGLSDKDNSVSRTDNFVNANFFNSVTSSRVLSYRKSKVARKEELIHETIAALTSNAGHLG